MSAVPPSYYYMSLRSGNPAIPVTQGYPSHTLPEDAQTRQFYPVPQPWFGAGVFLPPVIFPPFAAFPFWI